MGRYKKRYNNDDDVVGAIAGLFLLIGMFVLPLIIKYWLYIVVILIIILIYLLTRIIIDLDLGSKFKKPYFYYQGNHGEKWLNELNKNNDEQKSKILKSGIYGENQIIYELQNSNIPMYIMHDLKLEFEEYKSQIDIVIITKRDIYFIESKNLKGNINIENDGTVVRRYKKNVSGFKNPLTQIEKHKIVINNIFRKEKLNVHFNYWIVFTNDENYIKTKSEAIASKVMRKDKLIHNIKKNENKKHLKRKEEDMKNICDILLKYEAKEREIISNDELFNKLKEYRKNKMIEEKVDAYIIFNNDTLNDLINKRPKTIEELYLITGLGEIKINKYGKDLIKIIND